VHKLNAFDVDQARRSLGAAPSQWLALPPTGPPAAPVPPAAVLAPEAGAVAPPAIAAVPTPAPSPTPALRGPAWAVSPPGGLRYSGRLGSTLIEARRPGGVNVIETGDSEVVLTGGDLSVRIALEPGRTVRVRPVTAAGWSAARSTAGDAIWGIQGYLVNPRLGRALGASSGVLVLDVAGNSSADSLGIRPGDVLVSLNDHPIVAVTPGTLLEFRGLRLVPNRPAVHSLVVVRSGVRRSLPLPRTSGPRDSAGEPPPRRER